MLVFITIKRKREKRKHKQKILSRVFVPVNSKTVHAPPPRANHRAFDFFEKFWSNSPLCRGGSRGGETGEFLSPLVSFFFSYPSNIDWFYKNSPPISKSWIRACYVASSDGQTPPVRASKRVKSPTPRHVKANCGKKFCKIFSHYEFLVQLVFAPHYRNLMKRFSSFSR